MRHHIYPPHSHLETTKDNDDLYEEIDDQYAGINVSLVSPRKETGFYNLIEEGLNTTNYSLLEPEYYILEDERTMCLDLECCTSPDIKNYLVGTYDLNY